MTRSKNSESTANSRYASSLNVPGYRIREGRTADGAAVGAMWRELMAMHQSLDARFIVAPDGEARYIRHAQEMTRSRDSRVLIAVFLMPSNGWAKSIPSGSPFLSPRIKCCCLQRCRPDRRDRN